MLVQAPTCACLFCSPSAPPSPFPARPPARPPTVDQVTMTDLPEALPILRHNTEATFATLAGGSASHDASKRVEACRRPTIRQLCWGNAVEAGEVAAAAAAAAVPVEGGGEGSEWQGFDLVVVREGKEGREGRFAAVPEVSLGAVQMLCAVRNELK